LLQNADSWVLGQARRKARQGRLAEAEVDARRALFSRLKEQGKYHPLTPKYIMGLARNLIEQGRYEEAERLTRIAIEINQKVGVVRDSELAARDPSLAALIRSEQDLTMQVNALFGTLSNVLALAPAERDEEGVKAINATIAKMRADRDEARNEIARRFPSYRDFIDPKPLTADALRASLRQGEALLSFYFGQYASFAWVVPKDGPTAFAAIPTTADAMERKVRGLRRTLEAEVERVADLPVYDLALAYELYGLPLKPLQASWMPARHLIVVTNGALGLLLLSLLPTAPAPLEQDQGIAVCRLPKRAVAGAHPRCDERTLGLGAVGIAATAARFRQARAADRLRRPLLQPRASAARGGKTHRGSGRGRRGARRAPSRRTRRRERRQRRACAAAAPAGYRR
jgi:hypothetical protein